jgi:signal transduction histidine kinase
MDEAQEMRLFRVLMAGFALLIALLATSVYVGVQSMRSIESETAQLMERQRTVLGLIEEVQREEDSLSAVLFELAAGNGETPREELLRRLDKLESLIQKTTEAGLASANPARWVEVKQGLARFIAEGRKLVVPQAPPPLEFYRAHEALIGALGDLATLHFDAAASAQRREMEHSGRRVRFSVGLLATALAIALIGTFLTVRVVRRMFRHLQWQTEELSHLSSRTMADQEAAARRFSRELHDEFGQNLSALEANLVAMQNARQFHQTRMEDCLALVKQAIDNTRELSQLLRPTVLDDFGLDASLRWIADGFAQRTGIAVDYRSTPVGRLSDEIETQVFRICQEALTNVSRHANATAVQVVLSAGEDMLSLEVSDNGQGILSKKQGGGLGLVGMRARARAAAGSLAVTSHPGKGVTIRLDLPLTKRDHAAQTSHSGG